MTAPKEALDPTSRSRRARDRQPEFQLPVVPEFKDPHDPRLSFHFHEGELGVEKADARVKANARYLCEKLLEPIRAKYGLPVFVTSGHRSTEHNQRVGGKSKSFHLFGEDRCAADFKVIGIDVVETFDWLRLESGLPFDKVILEYHQGEPRVIHIQAKVKAAPRRLAFVGETGDAKEYRPVEVA